MQCDIEYWNFSFTVFFTVMLLFVISRWFQSPLGQCTATCLVLRSDRADNASDVAVVSPSGEATLFSLK